jgi:hypothetical protein
MVVRASTFTALDGFDERIGVGSLGVFQSGEGSDLVARAVHAGARIVDLSRSVSAGEAAQESGGELKAKRWRYAPGAAFVLGKNSHLSGRNRAFARMLLGVAYRQRSLLPIMSVVRAFREGHRAARRINS